MHGKRKSLRLYAVKQQRRWTTLQSKPSQDSLKPFHFFCLETFELSTVLRTFKCVGVGPILLVSWSKQAWDQRLYQEVPNKNKKDKHAKHDMVKLGFNGASAHGDHPPKYNLLGRLYIFGPGFT